MLGFSIRQIFVILPFLFSTLFPPSANLFHPIQSGGEIEKEAVIFIKLLSQRKYEEAYSSFDEPMQKAISLQGLQDIWEGLLTKYGAYQSVGEIRIEKAGQYTAANVHTTFERGDINIRVVYSQTGQISGLFYTPLFTKPDSIPGGLIVAFALSGVFTIIYPVLLGFFFNKRSGASWKFFFLGMGIFIIFQLATRIPLVSIIEGVFGRQLRSTTWLLAAWVIFLSFTAGLFEETGRYVGYRWMMARDPKTWKVGVMYGLGHGGIESMVLVGLNNLVVPITVLAYPLLQPWLPGEIQGALGQQLGGLIGLPDWLPLLAAWERLWTIPVHVALSVIVLQVFRRGSVRWLWLSITLHTLVNLFVIGLVMMIPLRPEQQPILSSLPVFIVGVLAVWVIWHFRESKSTRRGDKDVLSEK